MRGRFVPLVIAAAIASAIALALVASRQSDHVTHADATGLVVVPCRSIASAVDGNASDPPSAQDLYVTCGSGYTPPSIPPTGAISIAALASAIGDQDGRLESSDFAVIQALSTNEIASSCIRLAPDCTLNVFVFVDDEAPVRFEPPGVFSFYPHEVLVPPTPTPTPSPTPTPIVTPSPTPTCAATAPNHCSGLRPYAVEDDNLWICDLNSEDADCSGVPSGDGDGVVHHKP